MTPLRHTIAASVLAVALASFSQDLAAQGIGGRLRQRAQQAAERALDKAEDAVKCAVTDTACIEKAEREGKAVTVTDASGEVVSERPAGAAPAAAALPGEGAWANFDFMPGERPLFVEDFTRDRVGNFPRRFELISGTTEVVDVSGKRWLRAQDRGGFVVTLPEVLPERWTMEFDMIARWERLVIMAGEGEINDGDVLEFSNQASKIYLGGYEAGIYRSGMEGSSSLDPREYFPNLFAEGLRGTRVFRVRVQADGNYMKVYLDEKRISNMPNASWPRTDKLVFSHEAGEHPLMISNLTINAGGSELYDALSSTGRIALQGIYFDTGSDRIRPESSGTLSEIQMMLEQYGDLKVLIEGHTDNTGDAGANQTLSEARAAAVVKYLSDKGINAARLQSKGFGASNPAAPNETPEGRQKNRRVELVKL